MKGSRTNIEFNYLHRDDGNYKIYGAKIFSNTQGLELIDIEEELRKSFIDREYFFPKKLSIPLLDGSHTLWHFNDWYEFDRITYTDEEENTMIDISELLLQVKTFKNVSD